jgi:hypothetical protein
MNSNRNPDAIDKGERNYHKLETGSTECKYVLTKGYFVCLFLVLFVVLQITFTYSYLDRSFDRDSGLYVLSFNDLSRGRFDRTAFGFNFGSGFDSGFGFQRVYAIPDVYESPLPNHVPTAYSGASFTTKDTPIVITLRAIDQDGDSLTFFPSHLITKTAHGKLGSLTDYRTSSSLTMAQITYFPDPGYTGTDSFSYQVADKNNAASNVATISVVIL